jgi:hypothetical protein
MGFERSPTAWSPISQGSEKIYRPRQRNLRKVRAGPRATGTTGRVMTVEMDIGWFLGLELWKLVVLDFVTCLYKRFGIFIGDLG